MIAHGVLVAGCLLLVAGVLCWPVHDRRRRVLVSVAAAGTGGDNGTRSETAGRPVRAWSLPAWRNLATWAAAWRAAGRRDGTRPDRVAVRRASVGGSVRWVLGAGGSSGFCAGVLAGPVAGVVAAVYTGLAVRAVVRHRAARVRAETHARTLDGLCALAADLRAGLPPAVAPSSQPAPGTRIAQLTSAVRRLAEQTGAPVAELVERIEADARAAERSGAAAAAQAAGARATAWLLSALPLGGIGLGYGIGADPLHVLLHTPIGASCTVAAIILQLAGLAWADRLSGHPNGAQA